MIQSQRRSRPVYVPNSGHRGRRIRSKVVLLSAMAALVAPKITWAANLTWDPAQNGTGSDGSGNWDLSDPFWSNGGDVVWPNDTSIAVFGSNGTAGAVTLTSA